MNHKEGLGPFGIDPKTRIRAVVDAKTGKPGCVLHQAVFGGDRRACELIDSEHWEVGILRRPEMVTGTAEQWCQLGRELERRSRRSRGNKR